jgi:hypothetical protein
MGWRYVLVNHTRKTIEDVGLERIWSDMKFLIEKEGWSMDDDVVMWFEERNWTEIMECVHSGYRSKYRSD